MAGQQKLSGMMVLEDHMYLTCMGLLQSMIACFFEVHFNQKGGPIVTSNKNKQTKSNIVKKKKKTSSKGSSDFTQTINRLIQRVMTLWSLLVMRS